MIPIRLQLKNFMSYGENVNPIDFTGMHVACLSGENGHGKTALLDAITWALWGQARAGTDELIRIGTNDMSVVFDFELAGNLYRVIKAASRKRSAGMWELQVSDGDGGYKPITGQGIRDTGKQIERLLKMDYRTFINSAYIQQGKADEFTRQTVGDRKKVLADILDLSRYDQLAKKAKDHRDAAEQKVEVFRREIERLDGELDMKQSLQSAYQSAQEDLARVRWVILASETTLKTLEQRKAEMETEHARALEMRTEMASAESEITMLEQRLQTVQERISEAEAITAGRSEIMEGYNSLERLRQRNQELESVAGRHLLLQTKRASLQHVVEAEQHNLDLKLKMADQELAEAYGRLDEKPYLEREINELKGQLAGLQEPDSDMISRSACKIECRIAQAKQMLLTVNRTNDLLPTLSERVSRLQRQIEERSSKDGSEKLSEMDRQITELAYDPVEHARIKEEETVFQDWQRRKIELDQAESRLPEDQATASTLMELIESKQQLIEKDNRALKWAEDKLGAMPELEDELEASASELQSLRSEESEITSRCAVYEHKLQELEDIRQQKSALIQSVESAEKDMAAYSELAKAFGRSGVQSLIIENAVPEIQEEANEILSRMTDGNMHINLETLKETKTSGTSVETLDVRVRDEIGDRDYSLLSGGEAFRVNFALRIALSKLLARRAGAKLETLIIDEGFGTQDVKGREKLVESIDAVKDDFRRILVITHIEELKDAFPVRIEVTKDRDGSQVTVA